MSRAGEAAAKSMHGRGEPHDEVHRYWSDQHDANIQYAGFHTSWDALVVRGSMVSRSLVALYLNNGLIDAAVAINRGKDLRRTIPLTKARSVRIARCGEAPHIDRLVAEAACI